MEGLLRVQSEYDVDNFSDYLGRTFDAAERAELFAGILAAKRWTFLESGVTHPRFIELLEEVTTPEQRERVSVAVTQLLTSAA